MKIKILIGLLLILSGALIFNSCDKVDEYLVIVDQQDITDDYLDTLYIIDSVTISQKQVLLEDFTGHTCINCPKWAYFAHGWSEENDHRLIIYAVHAGEYAEPDPDPEGIYTADLRCQVGIELNFDFGVFEIGYPSGLINRIFYDGLQVIPPFIWDEVFEQEINKENAIDLKVQNTYYPNLNIVQVDVLTTFLQQLEGSFKLAAYIVEDSIVSPQRNSDHSIPGSPPEGEDDWLDYVHRNLLRDAINGKEGTYFSDDGTITSGTEYASKFTYELNDEWVAANCNIIVYIYNEETDEVFQVAELGIKTEE